MGFRAEWTNADALAFRPYTAYTSTPVTYSAATDSTGDLERENDELRELVRDMWGWATGLCLGCKHADTVLGVLVCHADGGCALRHELEQRTAELGIEVDG